jgi:RNA polymerase sigma-70 factor (ECF subfamily)
MTVGLNSMPFPARGQPSSARRSALPVSSPLSTADADAQRLAAAVGSGDETAFRELYDRYHDRLFRCALVLARGDESVAGDTVQSAFVTAATKLRRVQSEEHLWNWLARVARQHLAKVWRQQRRAATVVGVEDLPDCAGPGELDSVLEEKLEAALRSMEPEERQMIEWFYFDGLSHKEMAAQLVATPKAISSRLERARARLRSLLHRSLSDES